MPKELNEVCERFRSVVKAHLPDNPLARAEIIDACVAVVTEAYNRGVTSSNARLSPETQFVHTQSFSQSATTKT